MPIRDEILAAAEQIIRDHGVGHATTRRIAAIAHCSEGSIYNHFASKDELIAQAVGERMSAFPAYAHSLPGRAGQGELAGNLRTLTRLAVGFFHGIAPMLGAMMADPDAMRPRARELDEQGHGPRWVLLAVVDYLRREQELGRVRPDASLEGAAISLVGGCLSQALLAHTWGADTRLLDDDAAAAEIVAAVVRGLAPTGGGAGWLGLGPAAEARTGPAPDPVDDRIGDRGETSVAVDEEQ